jgi:hypothetical protein
VATFADLGVTVPLFVADVRFAEGIQPSGTCVLCGRRTACVPLDRVRVPCVGCVGEVILPAHGRSLRATEHCPNCGLRLELADGLIPAAAEALRADVPVRLLGCGGCLRLGRWTRSHDTERGPVEDGELARTPRYATFQGERWLYCHDAPMVYLGEWGRADFEAERPGAGRDLFASLVEDVPVDEAWAYGLDERAGESDLRVYVFRCPHCAQLRTHTDA